MIRRNADRPIFIVIAACIVAIAILSQDDCGCARRPLVLAPGQVST